MEEKTARQVYEEWIAQKMDSPCRAENESYELCELEEDYVHALIKHDLGNGCVQYGLYKFYEDYMVRCIHIWKEMPMARMAFKLFCYEMPEEVDKHWEGNRQIALYSDELRKHEAVGALECERRHGRCLGCPFDGLVCNGRH